MITESGQSHEFGLRVAGRSSGVLGRPEDVLQREGMTLAEKRAILAEWASDARAVENAPALRRLDDGSIVDLDDVLRALRALDEESGVQVSSAVVRSFPDRRGRFLHRFRLMRRRDDDDDPPPCPASAAIPVRRYVVDAVAA